MWCFRRNRSKKQLYKAMVDNLVLAEESNQALLAEVKRLKEERSHLVKTQEAETQKLNEQATQLLMEKSAMEKDFLDSTNLIQHQLDTTLEEKNSLYFSLQETSAELQSVKDEVRTLEMRAEEDGRRKDSIIKDAEHYIDELKTKMQNQEMHLRKGIYELKEKLLRSQKEIEEFRKNFVLKNFIIAEMEEEMLKCKAQEAETQKLKEQVTQLQMEKWALEKDFLDSTTLLQHQLDTTLQEKNSIQQSLQVTSTELQSAKDKVQHLEVACAKYEERNKEVTNFSTILKEEKEDLSTALESLKLTLNNEKEAMSTALESEKQTLRRAEEDCRQKDSIIKDAEHYIDELKTKMQNQEMHLRKEMDEELMKCKESKAVAVRSLRKALDENIRLHYEMKNPSKQKIQDPQEDHAPQYPQKKWRRSRQNTHVYRPNQPPLVTVPKN